MAIELRPQNTNVISLEEFIEYAEEHVDMRDEQSLKDAAPMMKALGNNRDFLADKINEELVKLANFQEDNHYGAQVLMLGRCKKFFMRACFWPSAQDKSYKESGPESFFYYLPHDHNFNFLSVGYYGPGYKSEYYEYDHDKVIGMPGEKVDLRYIRTSQLEQGKVMLYRGKKDIHYQIPPESFSISINLMEDSLDLPRINQYRFDLENKRIHSLINRNSGPVLADIAAKVGNDNTRQLLSDLGQRTTCLRTKSAIVKSLATRLPQTQKIDFIESHLTGKNDYFNAQLRHQISELQVRETSLC